ncbi:TlpA family protein disulfide reductase [Sediminibacterium ginsengisoli]|uniref:Thiol-disulfide isomerase or thioredoxin n=1 Tax=Sediminibacterium ginsengisoli TaxID=413434 RepID=A0A1T4R182_9BACT|nr:TlpA disulfide reductase family protein [Sediminibacterium ginsengisoli]SKA09754.1 Thiol-disulfide isomerase or thioredoxin [Sediminibacterium ginsengisoli]
MKNMYVLLLSVLILQTGIAQKNNATVTVAVTLINATAATPKAIRMNFLNPFQPNSQSAVFDRQNQLCLREAMLFTQNMTVQYNGTFINLYVKPGDSIHLTIDASLLDKRDFEWVSFQGEHAALSKQLNDWYHFASKLPYKKYDYALSPQHMLTAVEMDYDRYMQELKKYTALHPLDPVIERWAEGDIRYLLSNWISDYAGIKNVSTEERKERQQLFAAPFFKMYDTAGFSSMMFPYHLSAYAYQLVRNDSGILKLANAGRAREALEAGISLIQKEPAGINRDYMLFSYLTSQLRSNAAALDSLGNTDHYFTNPVAAAYMRSFVKQVNYPVFPSAPITGVSRSGKNALPEALPEGDIFAYLTKKYPGKVLYLDVYATWCVPCLNEMTYMPGIQESFRNKNVVFVNLCLQSEKSKWLALLQKEKIKGEQLFLDEDATKLFMSLYGVKGFPTYMLVDKKGKIRTNTAPRPSEEKALTAAIGKLLAER